MSMRRAVLLSVATLIAAATPAVADDAALVDPFETEGIPGEPTVEIEPRVEIEPAQEAADPHDDGCVATRNRIAGRAAHIADDQARARVLHLMPDCTAPMVMRTRASALVPDAGALDAEEPAMETPPLSGGRVLGELAIGGLMGMGVGLLGGFALGSSQNDLGAMLLGAVGGNMLGAAAGVYWVGSTGDETGSLGFTFLGSLAGVFGGGLVATRLASTSESLAVAAFIAGPTVGAMIAFNLTRRYEPTARRKTWTPVVAPGSDSTYVGVAGAF